MIQYQAPRMTVFQQMLNRLGMAVIVKMKPILDRNAGGLARDMTKITPPLVGGRLGTGGTAAAYYAGDKSLRGDIKRVFKPLDSIPFASLIKGRQYRAAAQYQFQFDNPKLAKAYREGRWQSIYHAFAKSPNTAQFPPVMNTAVVDTANKFSHNAARVKGRVPKGVKPTFVVKKQSIDTYAKAMKKHIGMMVSGWAWCATRLKAMVQPNWTGRNPKGIIAYKTTKKEQSVTITNTLGNYDGWMDKNRGAVNAALNHWAKKCRDESEKLLKQELEKARNRAAGINPTGRP